MAEWRYKLEFHGKDLREKINNGGEDLESCKATLQALKDCYDQIKRLVKDDWWNFESDYDSLEYYIDVLNNPDEGAREDALLDGGYNGFNPALECVNDSLRAFYDLCDYYRIWVGV